MTGSSFTRRGFMGLVAAAGLAGPLAGCSSSASSGAKSASLQVELWGNATRADLYKQAIKLFTDAHAGTTATLQFADLNPYLERLATQSAAGNLPDLLWMRDTHIGRYGQAKVLLDFTPYLDKTIHATDLGKQAVPDGKVGSGVYALPTHYVGQAIVGSGTALDKKGVKLADVQTWDDLANAAKELTDPSSGVFGMIDSSLSPSTHRDVEAWIRQHGEEVFTPAGGPAFTAATLTSYFTYFDQLRKAKVVPTPDVQTQSFSAGLTGDLVVTGKAALTPTSSNQLTQMQPLTKIPLQMASLPAAKDASKDWWFFPPILISASGKTKSPDAAAQLIDFFLNDVDAAKITRLNQGAPSSSKILDALLPSLNPTEKIFIAQIRREQDYPSRPLPIRPQGASQLDTIISQAGQEIAFGKASISQAVSDLMAAAKKALPES
jgi:multiple sugar transport system substrate-binding protein